MDHSSANSSTTTAQVLVLLVLLVLQLIATYRGVCPSFHIGEGERGGASCGCGLLVDSRVLTPCALCVYTAQATRR